MEEKFEIKPIGKVVSENNHLFIKINEQYRAGLKNIEGFSHLQVLWWAHLSDNPEYRNNLISRKLFKRGPDQMGIFATRSPVRPNPVMVSIVLVQRIDHKNGIISISFIDAENESPVMDIKPYNKMERVKNCKVPDWCKHWPEWYEDTSSHNWEEEINF
jgi:tRNA-Thr(GGU) m(6)t(6)A37 methyltransferase TsaA